MKPLRIPIRKAIEGLPAVRLRAFYLPAVLLLFILFKSSYLNLPFYWDEAWSYATAIFEMAGQGPTLLPGSANAELTRGHPLFFYFLSASWLNIFGTTPVSAHILSLVLSCLLIMVLFLFCRSYFNLSTAMLAVSFLVLQSVFLAQSVLLLPEVLIALLVITSISAYFRGQRGLFLASTTLLVLTKETGMVVATVFILDAWVIRRFFVHGDDRVCRLRLSQTWHLLLPPAIFILYIIMQKIRLGWYFYPGHMDMLDFSWKGLLATGSAFGSGLFLRNGRSILLLAALAAYAVLRVRGCLSARERHFLRFSVLLVLAYGAFSAVNFFTQRYTLALLPVYLAAVASLLTSVLARKPFALLAVTTGFLVLFAWQTRTGIWNESDISLGYKETVLLHREVVHYAGEMEWQDRLVYSAFLMQYNLSQPRLGYLKQGHEPFTQVRNISGLPYDLYIFCSNERDSLRDKLASDNNFILLKRFERGRAWVEIYAPVNCLAGSG